MKKIINLITEENKENNYLPFRYLFLNAVNFDTNIKLISTNRQTNKSKVNHKRSVISNQ